MKISIDKKKKLQALLGAISTDAEKKEIQKLDALKVKEIAEFFEQVETENESRVERLEQTLAKVLSSFDGYRKASDAHSRYLVQTFGKFSDTMVEKIGELGGTITTNYEKNKPINTAGVYKDMLNQLSAVNKSIIDKPVPVWNWPQYASVGVRNKNFANVNPATEENQNYATGYSAYKITLVGTVCYQAFAGVGTTYATPQWQASKIDFTDLTNIQTTWANGNQDFVNTATDLTTLVYS